MNFRESSTDRKVQYEKSKSGFIKETMNNTQDCFANFQSVTRICSFYFMKKNNMKQVKVKRSTQNKPQLKLVFPTFMWHSFPLFLYLGKTAPLVIQNIFNKIFYSELEAGVEGKWAKLYGHPILKTLYIAFFHGFVIPVRKYYSYLHEDYLRHCPPDHVAAGLVHLPVSYQYLDGSPDFNKPTTAKLPLVKSQLNGKALYEKILKRYTTLDVTPDEVFEEGKKQVQEFFPKVRNSLLSFELWIYQKHQTNLVR